MRSDAHLGAAQQALTGLGKLSTSNECPAVIEGAYVVAYHVLNGLMHRKRLLSDDKHINSPSHSSLHAEDLPRRLQTVWRVFETLEDLRLEFVWSPSPYTTDAGARIARCLDSLASAGDLSRTR